MKSIGQWSAAWDPFYQPGQAPYAPGTRRHIRGALVAGATVKEIMEVLKLGVVKGVQSCNMGVPILAEELSRRDHAP